MQTFREQMGTRMHPAPGVTTFAGPAYALGEAPAAAMTYTISFADDPEDGPGDPPLQVSDNRAFPGIPCTSGCAGPAVLHLEILRYGVEDLQLCQACVDTLRHALAALPALMPLPGS